MHCQENKMDFCSSDKYFD